MQWHWGNIGSAAAGIAALIATVAAVYGVIRYGPAWLRDSRERQQAQAAAAREQEALARGQAEQIRLDRRRHLSGWSGHGIDTFAVALVTSAEQMDQAKTELLAGNVPSEYVVLRVAEGPANVNRARSLRQLIETEGAISRPPSAGEREALETGLNAMGIQWAGSSRRPEGRGRRRRAPRRSRRAGPPLHSDASQGQRIDCENVQDTVFKVSTTNGDIGQVNSAVAQGLLDRQRAWLPGPAPGMAWEHAASRAFVTVLPTRYFASRGAMNGSTSLWHEREGPNAQDVA